MSRACPFIRALRHPLFLWAMVAAAMAIVLWLAQWRPQ